MKKAISFVLNGNEMAMEVETYWTLLHLLREELELTGSKSGCESGECGACTVLVNGKAVNACLFPAMEINGAAVLTIEGLAKPSGELHPFRAPSWNWGRSNAGTALPAWFFPQKPFG
jgi:aerobic carbon-monoxide dehydrogenase small subunit